MPDLDNILKIKNDISTNEKKLDKLKTEIDSLWENTGLDPKDPSYLVEKTMRFEMAQENINEVFITTYKIITSYKRLCEKLEEQS